MESEIVRNGDDFVVEGPGHPPSNLIIPKSTKLTIMESNSTMKPQYYFFLVIVLISVNRVVAYTCFINLRLSQNIELLKSTETFGRRVS